MDESDDEESEIKAERDEKVERWEEADRVGADRGQRTIRRLIDPRRPSQADVNLHELNHIPYRIWCKHCVRGQGKNLDHRKAVDEERGLSEYSFD